MKKLYLDYICIVDTDELGKKYSGFIRLDPYGRKSKTIDFVLLDPFEEWAQVRYVDYNNSVLYGTGYTSIGDHHISKLAIVRFRFGAESVVTLAFLNVLTIIVLDCIHQAYAASTAQTVFSATHKQNIHPYLLSNFLNAFEPAELSETA